MTLKDYLAANGESIEAFAAKVEMSPGAVHKYVYRQRQPAINVADRIERATGGQVTMRDLVLAAA